MNSKLTIGVMAMLAAAALLTACDEQRDCENVVYCVHDPGEDEDCGGAVCGPNQVCVPQDDQCGMSNPDDVVCKDVPLDCNYPAWQWEPSCGCDGVVYPASCHTLAPTALSSCSQIQCGSEQCDKTTEYCEVLSDAAPSCKAIPSSCGSTADCSCLAGETCGDKCQGSAESGFKLACDKP